MYRGDFFGKLNSYTGTKLQHLRHLHRAIQKNSVETDETLKADAYEECRQIISNPDAFTEIPRQALDRFNQRALMLRGSVDSQNLKLALNLTENLTRQWEENLSERFTHPDDENITCIAPRCPDTVDGSGIIIGKGFNLRTRHCYKTKELKFRSHSYPKEMDREEIVRPVTELRALLKAALIPRERIDKFVAAQQYKGSAAKEHCEQHRSELYLTETEADRLLELVYPCYESDALLQINHKTLMEAAGAPTIRWHKLDYRIKVLLTDLCFTGDFNKQSRQFLHYFIGHNDLEGLRCFFCNRNNWTSESFQWTSTSPFIAVPPSDEVWNTRFVPRIDFINSEMLSLLRNSGNPRSLSTLEPAGMCHVDPTTNTVSKLPTILPELLKICWMTQPSSQTTPESLSENGFAPPSRFQRLRDTDFKIADICFPHPEAHYKIEKVDGNPDQVRLKLNGRPNFVEKGYRLRFRHNDEQKFRYLKVVDITEGNKLTLETVKPEKRIDFTKLVNEPISFDIPLFLPLNKMGIGDLLGDALPAIDSIVSSANDLVEELQKHVKVRPGRIEIPLKLTLSIARKNKKGEVVKQPFDFYWTVIFKKVNGEWVLGDGSTRFRMRLPQSEGDQIIDFGIFTLVLPPREQFDKKLESDEEADLYFDVASRELGFTFATLDKEKEEVAKVYFPGGIADEVDATTPKERKKQIERAAKKRFLLELERFEFDEENSGFLRINPQGISVKAKVTDQLVSVQETSDDVQVPVELKPQARSSSGLASQIYILNNTIIEATLFAKMKLPGFKQLEASVSASLKQTTPGEVPSVVATIELENGNKTPLAELDLNAFQLKVDAIRMELGWSSRTKEWDFQGEVDGQISFTSIADIIPDLEDLKQLSAIKVKELNLKKLNMPTIGLALSQTEPTRFDILDGLFSCQFEDLGVEWKFGGRPEGKLTCEKCSFRFNRPSVMEVDVSVGGLEVIYKNDKFKIGTPSSIGLSVKVGPAVNFSGELGWVDTEGERYFFASGSVKLEGFPEIKALLKMGDRSQK